MGIGKKTAALDLFYVSTTALLYLTALFLYPTAVRAIRPGPYFLETYFGCLAASAVLSAIAARARATGWIHFVLMLRCYVLVVLGYSLGSFSATKIIMGVGLFVETGMYEENPYDWILVGCFAFILTATQVAPGLLGPSLLITEDVRIPVEDIVLSAACFLFAGFATIRIRRLEYCRRDAEELSRIQEANLEALAELNRNLQGYAQNIDEESAERERNRISREIHDISGYIFTNLIALMDAAGSLVKGNKTELAELLFTARNQAQEGLRETRTALRRLRDEQSGLTDCTHAIFKIVSIFKKVTNVQAEVNFGNLPHYLPQELSRTLYRTVQEALTNAVRHGKATRIRVGFWVEENVLKLSILDNGKGAFNIVKGIGLKGMEERIGVLGGTIRFGQAAEGGFSLSFEIPMPKGAHDVG